MTYTLTASTGSFALAGQAVGFPWLHRLVAGTGAFTKYHVIRNYILAARGYYS